MRQRYRYRSATVLNFVSENSGLYIICLTLAVLGFALGVYSTAQRELHEVVYGLVFFRAAIKIVFVFALLFLPKILFPNSRISVFAGLTAFIAAGFFAGAAACYLLRNCGFLGIINLFFLYVPIFILTFILLASAYALLYRDCQCCYKRYFELLFIILIANLLLTAVINIFFNIFFVNIVIVFNLPYICPVF